MGGKSFFKKDTIKKKEAKKRNTGKSQKKKPKVMANLIIPQSLWGP